MNKYRDAWIGIFLLICSVGFYIDSFNIKTMAVARIGPAFVPRLICIIIGVLSLGLIVKEIITARRNTSLENEKKIENMDKGSAFRVLGTVILLTIYISFLSKIGFIIMTIAYLIVQCTLIDPDRSIKRTVMYGILGVVTSVSVYYLFENVFQLILPAGILG